MTRLPIGHPARVLGMESASMIVGSVWRNGGIVYALRGWLECGRVGWWWRGDGNSGQKVQMQDDDYRRNAARTRAKACSRRFLCAVDELSRKIVINAHTALVGLF